MPTTPPPRSTPVSLYGSRVPVESTTPSATRPGATRCTAACATNHATTAASPAHEKRARPPRPGQAAGRKRSAPATHPVSLQAATRA